jgi:hypothetical protein
MPAEMIENDLQHVAIHEAGHAVIARALMLSCGPVSIEADWSDMSAGFAIIDDPQLIIEQWERVGKFRDLRSVSIGRIIAMMAGAEAEIEILGLCEGGDGEDRRQIRFMLDDITPDQAPFDRVERRLRSWTRVLIQKHRRAIERVAALLLERKSLRAEDVDEMLTFRRPACWQVPFWASDE